MAIWTALVGKRCLVRRTDSYHSGLVEVKILETSPSGNAVKLQLRDDFAAWFSAQEYTLVEILGRNSETMRLTEKEIEKLSKISLRESTKVEK